MLKKDAEGNDIPGTDDGQPEPTPAEKQAVQIAELIAAQKKQTADLEVMREEKNRLEQLLVSMREHPGSGSNDARRPAPRGQGRFADPDQRSEFEKKYSLPAEAADEIIDEAVSRLSRIQQEREESIRNGEALKKSFFGEYPDLVGYEPVIRHFSDQCTQLHPDWTLKQGFVEVARLSREYIKSKLGNTTGNEPPPVLSGGSNRQDGSPGGAPRLPGSDEPARTPTQDEEIRAEVAERTKLRAKAL